MTRGSTMLWAVLLALAGLAGCGREVKMALGCSVTPSLGLECTIRNEGTAAGSVCFEAVVTCAQGEHVAKVCSTRLEPREVEKHGVPALTPPVHLRERCYKYEFRNKQVAAR